MNYIFIKNSRLFYLQLYTLKLPYKPVDFAYLSKPYNRRQSQLIKTNFCISTVVLRIKQRVSI